MAVSRVRKRITNSEALKEMVESVRQRSTDRNGDLEDENHALRQYIEKLQRNLLELDVDSLKEASLPK